MTQMRLDGARLQRQTLRLYGELLARRSSWAGKIVFGCGEGFSRSGLATAGSIAGAASLVLDPDAGAVKSVMRDGGLDFVVNTLDEAVRVLKNEVRQKRAIGVGLIAPLAPVVEEMRERGIAPDLEVRLSSATGDVDPSFAADGAELNTLNLAIDSFGEVLRSAALNGWLEQHRWHEVLFPLDASTSARTMDAKLAELLPASDAVRQNWIRKVSAYQRAVAGSRLVWMTGAEQRAFVGATSSESR